MYPVVTGARKANLDVYYWQTDDRDSKLSDCAGKYDDYITAYPTTLIFKDGKLIKKFVGVCQLSWLKKQLTVNKKRPDYKI